VLLNLATNARDAMPRGGTLAIATANVDLDEASVRKQPGSSLGAFVRLTVSDTGTGIDPVSQAHIFEPFFTTKDVGKGTGLGLAAVHGIVKQSNGSIHVASEPGRGTTFTIYLPRQAMPSVAPEQNSVETPPTGTETILIVEDDQQLRHLARQVLARRGYTILEAAEGVRALALAADHDGKIDLLLSDVVLPGLSGRLVAERLLMQYPGMKVLFISGYTDAIIVRHGVLEAGVHFLHKPFVPNDLAKKVRQVLDGPTNESVSSA
jgi:CheY-like chemotaxis protein